MTSNHGRKKSSRILVRGNTQRRENNTGKHKQMQASATSRVNGNRMLEEIVLDSLRSDWEMVSKKQYCFGKEVVTMQNQVFQNFHLNKLPKA
eukprot:12557716-Ditylum_brightwellii.AAC.1